MADVQLEHYKSQFDYGPKHGGSICSPVCYKIALYLLDEDDATAKISIEERLTAKKVDLLMQDAVDIHAWWKNGDRSRPDYMLVADVMKHQPLDKTKFDSFEFGGLFQHDPIIAASAHLDPHSMPLDQMVRRLRHRTGSHPVAVMVTYGGHTRLFIATRPGRLLLFDSAPAGLYDVSKEWPDMPLNSKENVYSAVLLCRSTPPQI